MGPARLRDHRLAFTRWSLTWGGATGHVEPAPADDVWGVLWEIDAGCERTLDRYERVGAGMYRKEHVHVEHHGDGVKALIYLAEPDRPRTPSRRYVASLLRGARANGLPAEYVERLEAITP